jgi:hypothetical protein
MTNKQLNAKSTITINTSTTNAFCCGLLIMSRRFHFHLRAALDLLWMH